MMGSKENPGEFDCYANAEPDEPMFVLLARDPVAAEVVRYWSWRRWMLGSDGGKAPRPEFIQDEAVQVAEALHCADDMEAWREIHRAEG